jgi:uncharacterized protein
VLRRALEAARIGHSDKLDGMRRLDRFARAIEHGAEPHADVDAAIGHERSISAAFGGRTVRDDMREPHAPRPGRTGQLRLFDR